MSFNMWIFGLCLLFMNVDPVDSFQFQPRLKTPLFWHTAPSLTVQMVDHFASSPLRTRSNHLCTQHVSAQERKRNSVWTLKASISESKDSSSLDKIFKHTAIMTLCGAALGPFLDGYHSAFHVLQYENPLTLVVGGLQLLQSDYWVPPMFGLAAIILGLSYPYLDHLFNVAPSNREPSVPKVLTCISFFSMQYYLSGLLSFAGGSPSQLHATLAVTAMANWLVFDRTPTGATMSIVTGLAGPLLEISLLNLVPAVLGHPLYHYTQPDWLGIPLWIGWVYACGAAAVGNLARLIWNMR